MYDFFVIGDIMIDHVMGVTDPDIVRSIDERKHTVTIPFPTKIQLNEPMQIFPGGNAFNASNALKKLGLNVGIFSILGHDHLGQDVLQKLKVSGINTDMVQIDKEHNTNKSLILNIDSDRIVFSHHFVHQYELNEMPDTKYVYLTSLGEDDAHMLKQIAEHRKQKNFNLVFSPGTRQINEPFTDIKEVLAQTDILILNKREAKALSRLNSDSDENLLHGLRKLGPKTVIITRSARGSVAFDGNNLIKVGALKTEGVDSTGAGDTYSSTLVAALFLGKDLRTAMEWGAINAASVISMYGSTNGLLNQQELATRYSQEVGNLKYEESPAIKKEGSMEPQVINS